MEIFKKLERLQADNQTYAKLKPDEGSS